MKIKHILLAVAATSLIILAGCKNIIQTTFGLYDHGVMITNEGSYGSNTGSVSFYSTVTDSIYNDIFEQVNNRPLGDVVQSFCAKSGIGYIVVNNSNKVEVVQLNSFKSIGVIVAPFPRHFIPVSSGKAYLTCNDTIPGKVFVINTTTLAITDTIPVGNQPENLLMIGSTVFVANGNYGNDSTVSVIDVNTDKVIKTVNVADGACNMVTTDNQNIWIICQGNRVYDSDYHIIKETDSRLVKMRVSDYSITFSKIIGVKGDNCYPTRISADKLGNIYYAESDGVHKINAGVTNPVDQLLIQIDNSSGLAIYGMNVDPDSSNIYVMEAKGFASAGKLYIYNSLGHLLHTFNTGIAPNGAVIY